MNANRERVCPRHGVRWLVAKGGAECPVCRADRERQQLRAEIDALRSLVETPDAPELVEAEA